jgi:hypothetical protein
MEDALSDLQSSSENVIDFLEEVPWGTGTNIYGNRDTAEEDLEYLEVLPRKMLERTYGVSKQLGKQLFKDMEAAFISLANICDLAGKSRAGSTKSEEDGWYMEHVTDTMRKAKELLPVLRSLRSRLHQSLLTGELISCVDRIIELVTHGPDLLYQRLRSAEVQDLTARLIVLGSKHRLLDSNSLVWYYWGDCDTRQLRLYCEPDPDRFEDFGASLCAQLRILREKARLLSSETEDAENHGPESGSTRSELLQNIHAAGKDLEQATAPELDLDGLSQTEMAFADASVIKYLTERFGEEDDALGNWPRDWHECPEAFELWKARIREFRMVRAKQSLDDVRSIAEEQAKKETVTDSPDIEIPPERRSAPLSLTRMAQYWGGEMTPRKLKAMIGGGSLKAKQLNRQTFVFDTKDLPEKVIEKVKR